jgi:hypothetical protein
VFLRRRVSLDYAQRFLEPNQLDRVDWAKIPGVDAELAAFLSAHDAADAAAAQPGEAA